MNHYKLILAILLSSNFIFGQSTKELFSLPGYEIIMVAINSAEAPDENMSLYFESDTLFCGESVLKYNTSYGEDIYLNVVDGQVMVIDTCDSERLLFDFDVSIGDSLTVNGRRTEVVAIGDTILNDNKVRKTYSVKAPDNVSPDTELFIEGIGSQFTGLDYTKADSGYSTYFSCINDSDGQIHLSPFSNPVICEMFSMFSSSTNNVVENEDVVVYPNPTFDQLSILRQSNSTEYLKIINSQGEIIHEIKLESNINTVNTVELPQGIYFLMFSNNKNEIVSQTKVIKI